MYSKVTDMITAIFSIDLICSGDCQKTLTALTNFVTAMGADMFEAGFKETTSSAKFPLELYETEQQQMAKFIPRFPARRRPLRSSSEWAGWAAPRTRQISTNPSMPSSYW